MEKPRNRCCDVLFVNLPPLIQKNTKLTYNPQTNLLEITEDLAHAPYTYCYALTEKVGYIHVDAVLEEQIPIPVECKQCDFFGNGRKYCRNCVNYEPKQMISIKAVKQLITQSNDLGDLYDFLTEFEEEMKKKQFF